MKEELLLFNEYVQDQFKSKTKRKQIRTESKQRVPKRQDIFQPRGPDKRYSEDYSKASQQFKDEENGQLERQSFLAGHQFLDEELDLPYQ